MRPKALMIEPDIPTRRRLQLCLEAEGYIVLEAAGGRKGIDLAVQRRPDVVLLELCLPDMDGMTVLKVLRELSQAPIVILSGCDAGAHEAAALDNGADDYVPKPFGMGELLARLRAARRHAMFQWDIGLSTQPAPSRFEGGSQRRLVHEELQLQ